MLTKDASVAICYKNFAANKNISHIGLGVAALNNQKALRALGLKVDVLPILSAADLTATLAKAARTHVVISAPWLATADLQALCLEHTETIFYVVSHSNVGFLQADSNGVRLFREALGLEVGMHNFHAAGNSQRFVSWILECFGSPCALLPNCYFLDGLTPLFAPSFHHGQPLRIGVFGATRPLKNLMSAAAAALTIARDLRSPLELYLSAGRTEGGGDTVLNAVKALMGGLPNVTLVFNNWQTWPQFRETVRSMHLLLQPSYTESFNMVTADGIAQGVPSVVSPAIDWVPSYWQAEPDDVLDIARVGHALLLKRTAIHDGLAALKAHNANGLRSWAHTLGLTDLPVPHR